jgi:hypothetical protein
MNTKIQDAFKKVKEDIFSLDNEVQVLRKEITDLKAEMRNISSFLDEIRVKLAKKEVTTHTTHNATHPSKNATHPEIATHKHPLEALKYKNMNSSTGNEGVPTDRQTNRQTDMRHINQPENKVFENDNKNKEISGLERAKDILNSLDSLKKDLRLKLKKLTEQEMRVFSLIYQLDQEGEMVDYPLLSQKMGLSEGTIRDYIYKITNKGIPIKKERVNNKKVILHISKNLKQIASLNTIIKLREI